MTSQQRATTPDAIWRRCYHTDKTGETQMYTRFVKISLGFINKTSVWFSCDVNVWNGPILVKLILIRPTEVKNNYQVLDVNHNLSGDLCNFSPEVVLCPTRTKWATNCPQTLCETWVERPCMQVHIHTYIHVCTYVCMYISKFQKHLKPLIRKSTEGRAAVGTAGSGGSSFHPHTRGSTYPFPLSVEIEDKIIIFFI